MTSPARVSVIVPTRNRPTQLRQALASIRRLEGPDLRLEVIVGDNGSTAESRIVAEEFGARYVFTERTGASAARNAAMRVASGDYLAFLDDDDVWLPEHLRPHLALLRRRPELAGVVGQVVLADEQLVPFETAPWPESLPADGQLFFPFLRYFPQIGATVTRIAIRERIGLFDEALVGDQDWDWHLRLARAELVGFVPVPCVHFRQRMPGDEDELQKRRMRFTRRVFMRHALPAWREWESPLEFMKCLNKSMSPYFTYFRGALLRRAASRDAAGVLSAMGWMLVTGPVHGTRLLATDPELRRTLLEAALSSTVSRAVELTNQILS